MSQSSRIMRQLYPEIEPFNTFFLDTGTDHRVYVEESGNRSGLPVIFLHGGPGSGAKPHHRQYFDSARYRIVIFDQRGTGRSTPHGLLEDNSTHTLLDDIETIRTRLGVDRWVLFGGSWGATLALLYAQRYPERIRGLILRGTYLARARDYIWVLGGGVERVFPEYWDEFIGELARVAEAAGLPADFRLANPGPSKDPTGIDARAQRIIETLHACVHSDQHDIRLAAARAWARWTGRIVTYTIMDEYALDAGDEQKLIKEVGIEAHYARNRYFIAENQILDHIDAVPRVPVTIVHGRHDMTCPVASSWDVHRRLPGSRLAILPRAGHLAGEEPMIDALVTATDEMAEQVATQ